MPKDMNLDVVEAPGNLTYVHDDEPGITRRKAGTGWNYKGPDGETIATVSPGCRICPRCVRT